MHLYAGTGRAADGSAVREGHGGAAERQEAVAGKDDVHPVHQVQGAVPEYGRSG